MGTRPGTVLSHCFYIVNEISLESWWEIVNLLNCVNWIHCHTNPFLSFQYQCFHRFTSFLLWVDRGWKDGGGEVKSGAWSPSSHLLLPLYCRSKTARPGSPILPLNHLLCPRSCQDLPPWSLWAAVLLIPPTTQHPAPNHRRNQPERGSVFKKGQDLSHIISLLTHGNSYKSVQICSTSTGWYNQFVPVTDTLFGDVSVMVVPHQTASKYEIFALKSKPSKRIDYLDTCMGPCRPEARIDEEHMGSVSWSNCRLQAGLLLPAPKPIET